jgi:hypothetical protein
MQRQIRALTARGKRLAHNAKRGVPIAPESPTAFSGLSAVVYRLGGGDLQGRVDGVGNFRVQDLKRGPRIRFLPGAACYCSFSPSPSRRLQSTKFW